jgi:ubiquinone/menaquinone biosynthesis C-methylase UbiE
MAFKDHFSDRAAGYARARPRYPPQLFSALAGLTGARRLAWDCGTGNGQAAIGLAEHFDRVHATDASAAQLRQAEAHPRIRYEEAPESASGLAGHSADLVTVAQAAHWFDLDAFYREVNRVLRPGGVLAL